MSPSPSPSLSMLAWLSSPQSCFIIIFFRTSPPLVSQTGLSWQLTHGESHQLANGRCLSSSKSPSPSPLSSSLSSSFSSSSSPSLSSSSSSPSLSSSSSPSPAWDPQRRIQQLGFGGQILPLVFEALWHPVRPQLREARGSRLVKRIIPTSVFLTMMLTSSLRNPICNDDDYYSNTIGDDGADVLMVKSNVDLSADSDR